MLERVFKLTENGTSVRTEVVAGLTTFMTMSYIIFVNPGIVSATGMPLEAVTYATIISTAFATLLMAFLANYPIALAPGMGLNAYFTYTVVLGMGVPWQTALGAVFISGIVFILLTMTGVRESIIRAVPASLKAAISAGIGLFIAFIGLKNGGVIISNEATFVSLANLREAGPLLVLIGVLITSGMMARRVPGAILWGILLTALIGLPMGITPVPEGVAELPSFDHWRPVVASLDIKGALSLGLLEILFAFLFVDLFDTMGTLIGVARQGGFLTKEGQLPRAERALMADAVGTVGGSFFGTPTVTSYIESAAGVGAGGRTGLTGVVVALLFLLSLFLLPLVKVVATAPQLTAPALIIVGSLMMTAVTDIDWRKSAEAIPAFICMLAMPLSFSIATGIALGFIAYPVVMLFAGRAREVHWMMFILAALFVARFAFLGGG